METRLMGASANQESSRGDERNSIADIGDLAWLTSHLPPFVKIERRHEADFYGASSHIAAALNLRSVPRSLASWTHGPPTWWMDLKFPQQVAFHRTPFDRCLVVTSEHEQFLRSNGYLRAHAVGAPILYVPDLGVRRVADSLLVMPGHTLYNADHEAPFDEYARFIAGLRPEFKHIVACIHANDVAKGYWVAAFEKVGIPWVRGADSFDQNALTRMVTLFKLFDFVTTNALGSHIPYAAYFGCKVSLIGPRAPVREADMAEVLLYRENPALLRHTISGTERFFMNGNSTLFVHPAHAKQCAQFGVQALGFNSRRSAHEIGDLLGWNLSGRMELLARDIAHFGTRLPRRVWNRLARSGDFARRADR